MIGKKLQKALGLAVEELKRRRHEYLTLEHVLYGIASEPSGRKLIERCGGSAPVLRQALDHFFKTYMESLDEPTKDVYQTLAVQRVLDVLPQRLCVRTHDDTALYRRIIGHFSLFNNICVPLREVHVHRRDLADQLFLFCHLYLSFHS